MMQGEVAFKIGDIVEFRNDIFIDAQQYRAGQPYDVVDVLKRPNWFSPGKEIVHLQVVKDNKTSKFLEAELFKLVKPVETLPPEIVEETEKLPEIEPLTKLKKARRKYKMTQTPTKINQAAG